MTTPEKLKNAPCQYRSPSFQGVFRGRRRHPLRARTVLLKPVRETEYRTAMKYRCIIVEDNAIERDLMEVLLRKLDDLEIAGVFENGLQALTFLQQNQVDLAFTDIDMPELSGIDLLKSLRQPPAFVFASAHGGYAADGYDLDVLDFIKKPVRPDRLYRAVDKARDFLRQRPDRAEPVADDETLMARTSEGLHKLLLGDLAYAESKGNYSVLHLVNGSNLMVLIGLKQLEEQLSADRFIRIHKNYLINWTLAALIRKESVLVADKYEVPIGDSHRKELTERIAGYRTLKR